MVPGKIEIPTIAILLLSVVAMGCDLAFGRIFNWLTVGMGVAALAYSFMTQGLPGIATALLGMLAGLLLYGWMFWLRVLGGGDVKFLMALGAWGGPQFALDVAVLGILLGGAMALVLLAFKGRIADFLGRMRGFFLSLVVRELEVQKFQFDRKNTMPFGIPIAIAALWVQLDSPFLRWGIL